MEELEKLKTQIEKETDFEKLVELFSVAAGMIKQSVSKASKSRGKLLEIVRELDEYIEKEMEGSGC